MNYNLKKKQKKDHQIKIKRINQNLKNLKKLKNQLQKKNPKKDHQKKIKKMK